MKAAVFKAPGKPLVIESLADPAPGVGELVLRVGRCGICGTDLHMTDGHAATYPITRCWVTSMPAKSWPSGAAW